jgi:succinyl-CoA synthetase alpha subunit
MPYPSFSSGCIGIVAKSGTLSYEAVSSTTRVNLGQSLVIGVGGDWLAGTTLVDGVKVLLEDKHTKGIIIIGEVGGNTELEVADILSSWKGERKPVMGLIGGVTTLGGRVMGHAGAIRGVGDVGASDKIKAVCFILSLRLIIDTANYAGVVARISGGCYGERSGTIWTRHGETSWLRTGSP